ncbi:hypothetical protein GCM10009551_088820 [Nocardiopsis tropica]
MSSGGWRDRAGCAGDEPERWCDQPFVTAGHAARCEACPVLVACAEDALAMQTTGRVVRAGVLCERRTRDERERTDAQLIEQLAAHGVAVTVVTV